MRSPFRLKFATSGRIVHPGIVQQAARLQQWDSVALADAEIIVLGVRPAKKKLEQLMAARPELWLVPVDELDQLCQVDAFLAAVDAGSDLRAFGTVDLGARDLSEKHFAGCSIRVDGANLRGAHFDSVTLAGHGVDARNARFAGTLRGRLESSDLRGAVFDLGTRLDRFDGIEVDMDGANLEGVRVHMGRFEHARFGSANLGGVRFHATKMHGCRLDGQQFGEHPQNLVLTECSAKGTQIRLAPDARIAGCDFSNADLRGSWLAGLRSDAGEFHGAALDGTRFFTVSSKPEQAWTGPPALFAEMRCRMSLDGAVVEVVLEFAHGADYALGHRLTFIEGASKRTLRFQSEALPAVIRSLSATPDWSTLSFMKPPSSALRAQTEAYLERLFDQPFETPRPPTTRTTPPVDDTSALEFLIANRHRRAAWEIYADVLVQNGDPRGSRLVRMLAGDTSADVFNRSPTSRKANGLDWEWSMTFIRRVTLGRACTKKTLMKQVDRPDGRLLDWLHLPETPPASARWALESLPVRVLYFTGKYEKTLDSLKRPVPTVEALHSGAFDPEVLAELFPKLRTVSLDRLAPEFLDRLGISTCWYTRWLHDEPEAQVEAVGVLSRVPSLERLVLRFEPSEAMIAEASSHGVVLERSGKGTFIPDFRWASE